LLASGIKLRKSRHFTEKLGDRETREAYYAYVSLGHVFVTTVAVKINKITRSHCVFVDFGIQDAMRMHRITLSSAASPATTFCNIIS
jgi:hypothetical protein